MAQYARELGIDQIATGHYARISYDSESGRYQLRRAVDAIRISPTFCMIQDIASGVPFPGEQIKAETRRIATEFD